MIVGRRRIVVFSCLSLLALAGFALSLSRWPRGAVPRQPAGRLAMARCGAHARRTHLCRGGPRQPARHLLFRLGGRRRVEDRKRRPHLVPHRRRGHSDRLHRRHRGGPSNPNIVYVGTGEPDIRSQHSYGIGMFKSTDAGKTWTHIGLEATRQIGRVVVDPDEPQSRICRGAGPCLRSQSRARRLSLHRRRRHLEESAVQGQTLPNDVGAVELAIDPANPRVLYASLWATRRPPWSVYAPTNLPGGGLYKSTDGGDTWKQLAGGLPTDDFVGKIGMAVAPSNPNRVWAVVDDTGGACRARVRGGGGGGGAWWRHAPRAESISPMTPAPPGSWSTPRTGCGAAAGISSRDRRPTNPDRAYVMNTATFMTTDAGKTLVPVKGAPGGDDYHQALDQSQGRQPHGAQQRPGHGGQRGRRQELEHLVQPAHRRDLSRGRRQSLPLLALRRAAG